MLFRSIQDNDRSTALMSLRYDDESKTRFLFEDGDIMRVLIEAGADINIQAVVLF